MTTITQRLGRQTKDQIMDRLIADARDQHDRDRRKAAEVARDKAREGKSREARRTKSTAPITVTSADGSTRLEDPTPAPASPRPSRRRRRPSTSQKLPTRVPRLTAAQRRAQAEAEARAAEVERRRQIIVARAEAVTPLPYDNTGRPAVLEAGSNR